MKSEKSIPATSKQQKKSTFFNVAEITQLTPVQFLSKTANQPPSKEYSTLLLDFSRKHC